MTKTMVRLAAVLAFTLCTSACSTIDDLIGDDTPTGKPVADSGGFPPDTAPAPTDASAPAPVTTADNGAAPTAAPAPSGANPLTAGTEPAPGTEPAAAAPGSTTATADAPATAPSGPPDLASVPEKPSGTTNPDDQKEMADSLAADRARATYSSEALRGGSEPAAAPPAPASPSDTAVAEASPPAPASPPPAPTPAPSDTTPAPADNAAPTTPVTGGAVAPPPGSQPAVPANGVPGAQPTMMSDAQLGFKPSTAPALDPNISSFVAQPIIARYQQTAANAGIATGPIAPTQAVATNTRLRRGRARAVGGPEQMTGSVVANLDVLNSPSPSVYSNAAGMPPTAVVMFSGDGATLNAAGRAQIRAAVDAFQQHGGTGFIKVVGHSSSRTANMPVEKHLEAIFAKSQARANAVAREIIRLGVPASRVLVEAVGDSQPVYYESMPQGEDGNRRAEIFVQG